tara:strand:- start:2771 stop:3970 length:1200 start_codon:yes stop_codon:yes gene_type:complete
MNNIKVAVAGNVDSGKSTLIGVLSKDILDDGRGYARNFILKNKHEKETGRTSSITFNNIIKSDKSITLIDLAGHEKYLKTTMYGLSGLFVDYGIIVIGSNMGLNKITREHIGLMLYLKIPFIIVVTKLDICPTNVYERTMNNIKKKLNLPLFNKKSFIINDKNDIDTYFKIGNIESLIPVISISNKTGKNIDQLKIILDNLKYRKKWELDKDSGSMMYIDTVFVVNGIGMILAGTVKGDIKLNDKLWIGPIENRYVQIRVKSIHNNFRQNVSGLIDEEYGCLAINFITKKTFTRNQIRKGVIAFSDDKFKKNIVSSFKAEIKILHHSTTIKNNYEPVIHCGQVRQPARLKFIDNTEFIRTGDIAKVEFIFCRRKEYIEVGNTIFFRDGNTKGYGRVIEL